MGLRQAKSGFPKAKLFEYHSETPHMKQLSSDLVLINYLGRIRETYTGQNISGHYWYSDVVVRRGGRWLLLGEQEVFLSPATTPQGQSTDRERGLTQHPADPPPKAAVGGDA